MDFHVPIHREWWSVLLDLYCHEVPSAHIILEPIPDITESHRWESALEMIHSDPHLVVLTTLCILPHWGLLRVTF